MKECIYKPLTILKSVYNRKKKLNNESNLFFSATIGSFIKIFWYEGLIKNEDTLKTETNNEEPIEAIIQYRTEFSYPFFIDLY